MRQDGLPRSPTSRRYFITSSLNQSVSGALAYLTGLSDYFPFPPESLWLGEDGGDGRMACDTRRSAVSRGTDRRSAMRRSLNLFRS